MEDTEDTEDTKDTKDTKDTEEIESYQDYFMRIRQEEGTGNTFCVTTRIVEIMAVGAFSYLSCSFICRMLKLN